MSRQRLPNRRAAISFVMKHNEKDLHVTVGFFDALGVPVGMGGGPPAELFIEFFKSGTELRHAASDEGTLVSLALQAGIDLPTIHHALSRDEQNRPASIIAAVVAKVVEMFP